MAQQVGLAQPFGLSFRLGPQVPQPIEVAVEGSYSGAMLPSRGVQGA